jgi:hypothetical protein
MAGLTQVSGGDMGETRKDVTRNVILWLPVFCGELIMKEPEQIAEHLADGGYNVRVVCWGGNASPGIPARSEEAGIPRCLKGVKWGDSIIVADSGNIDRIELA